MRSTEDPLTFQLQFQKMIADFIFLIPALQETCPGVEIASREKRTRCALFKVQKLLCGQNLSSSYPIMYLPQVSRETSMRQGLGGWVPYVMLCYTTLLCYFEKECEQAQQDLKPNIALLPRGLKLQGCATNYSLILENWYPVLLPSVILNQFNIIIIKMMTVLPVPPSNTTGRIEMRILFRLDSIQSGFYSMAERRAPPLSTDELCLILLQEPKVLLSSCMGDGSFIMTIPS